jgi:hypothetical protein
LVACMSRVWQTTVISLIRLPRLDKSMFNRDEELLMRRLDKGHLAYLNYVRMEHWYNNPVLNGFCEMLIESMLYSQIYRAKYDALAKTAVTARKDSTVITDEIEGDNNDGEYKNPLSSSSDGFAKTRRTKYQFKRFISTTEHSSEYNVKEVVVHTLKRPPHAFGKIPSARSEALKQLGPDRQNLSRMVQIKSITSKGNSYYKPAD